MFWEQNTVARFAGPILGQKNTERIKMIALARPKSFSYELGPWALYSWVHQTAGRGPRERATKARWSATSFNSESTVDADKLPLKLQGQWFDSGAALVSPVGIFIMPRMTPLTVWRVCPPRSPSLLSGVWGPRGSWLVDLTNRQDKISWPREAAGPLRRPSPRRQARPPCEAGPD